MAYVGGDIDLSANFNVAVAKPIDPKTKVGVFADLALIPFVYSGLQTWVDADQKTYVLQNDLTTWLESGGGGGVTPTNGLQDISGDIGLGGALTQHTDIPGSTFDLRLGTSGSLLNDFEVHAEGMSLNGDGVNFGFGKSQIFTVLNVVELRSTPLVGGDITRLIINDFNQNGKIKIEDSIGNFGAYYAHDYSANGSLDNNWIAPIGYIDTLLQVISEPATKASSDANNSTGLAHDLNYAYFYTIGTGWGRTPLTYGY